ncbi:MAG TPA: hypothetical protein DIC41_08240 [Alphaproteobacteria bacterium]|jgi:hypothetical protein|nr:MAG: hypothetical protein CNE92_07175 [SAR116 cluster bacterium MED-G05]HAO56925.1 hypothetical protein [Alphaproteobacteria bacterium]HBD52679.1 hypothetical protein [Alphaproteobacteria bacterium]HBP58148.1 hypothetical protein [Alphaproteobacteria bacterium]HBP73613.1 hypothetical protein [Alphaproteobacteria bacterium]
MPQPPLNASGHYRQICFGRSSLPDHAYRFILVMFMARHVPLPLPPETAPCYDQLPTKTSLQKGQPGKNT